MSRLLLIFFCISFLSCHLRASWQYIPEGKDHGKESKKHIQVTKDFISKNLKTNKKYDPKKISEFIEFLKTQRDQIKQDSYETKIIEKIELEIKKPEKAREAAAKRLDPKKASFLRAYNGYLIPLMKEILKRSPNKGDKKACDALVDDFIRGYIPFYVPNAHRNIWPRDLDLMHNVKKMFNGYQFKEEEENDLVATNLVVSGKYYKDIKKCLGYSKGTGTYLKASETEKLKRCNFDTSLLNPGVSVLWQERKADVPVEEELIKNKFFPEEEEIIYFDEVNLRGHQSPKFKVFYKRNGKKIKLKLKMGYEVHTDTAATYLLQLAGLNQDTMKYYKQLKLYLGKTSYEEFKSTLANKYGVEGLLRCITARGEDEKGEWVLLHDFLLETRINKEIRIGPMDFSSWSLGNMREYRSLILLWGWLGIQNIKPANFKIVFKETEKGLKPLHRMHDVGTSLGTPFSLKKPKYILSLLEPQTSDVFPSHFIKFDKKKKRVEIEWNDISQFKRLFAYTTWDDLKWMSRKILKIKKEDISFALHRSGFPREVAEIYLIKLLSRRNDMISAFSLEDEFSPDKIPDLKNINIKNKDVVIEKGKVVRANYDDVNSIPYAAEKWSTFIPNLLKFVSLPIRDWQQPQTKNTASLGTEGITGLQVSMGVRDADQKPFALTTLPLGVGVQAVLSRNVSPHEQIVNNNRKFHVYKIEDRIKLKVGVDSPFLSKISGKAKFVEIEAGLRFYEYEFKFTHYEDDLKKAYFGKFNLIDILVKPIRYAAYKLQPLEMISTYHRVGLEIEGDVRVFSIKPGIQNQIALTAGVRKTSTNYLLRDSYGQLHIFLDKAQNSFLGFSFGLAEIDLFFLKLPFFSFGFSTHKFKSEITDYVFPLEKKDRRSVEDVLTTSRRHQEFVALEEFSKRRRKSDPLPKIMKTYYEVTSVGKNSSAKIGGAFLYNKQTSKIHAKTDITLPSGEVKKFLRYSKMIEKSKGVDSDSLPLLDLLMSKRKRINIDLEMNRDKPNKFVVAIKTHDYYRARSREQLVHLISDLNRRFSESPEDKFFQNYTLPEEEFTDKYKKIYGLVTVLIDGEDLIESLNKLDEDTLSEELRKHFWDNQFMMNNQKIDSISHFRLGKLKRRERSILSHIKKIKETFLNPPKDMQLRLSELYVKIIEKLHIEEFGVYFLKKLLMGKKIFVMGEIAGIHPSYTTLQDLQSRQRRRFAGKSWGLFNRQRPIHKYLRYQRVIQPLVFIEKNTSDDLTLGTLEMSVAPNLEALFGTATSF